MISSLVCFALAFAFALAACAALAVSQDRNWRKVMGTAAAAPKSARRAGWAFLVAALIPCVIHDGIAFAVLVWPLILTVAALAIAMALAYHPRILSPIAARFRQ
jgi:short subunit fatty acids transporter